MPNRGQSDRQWTHRLALQIIGLLPDDQEQAVAALDRARFLLESWQISEVETPTNLHVMRPKLVGQAD